jgi:hypothetical protein
VEYAQRHFESQDWITLMMVGCFLLLALAKHLYPKRFQEFVLLPVTNKYFLVQGKNNEVYHPFNILLFLYQAISVSLLVFLMFKKFRPAFSEHNPWLFVHIFAGYTLFVLLKFCVEKIVGVVFSIESLINNYLYQKLTYRNLLAIAIFTCNLVFFYIAAPSITSLFVLFLLIALLNCIALFYSYKTNGKLILSNFFYFILYLCALEISPYILLYKIVV